MIEKKQLNVRIPADIYDKIESSGRSKQDIVADALMLYFDSKTQQTEENNDSLVQTLQGEIEYLKKQFDILNQEKLELLRLLNQSQILQMQAQKQLTEVQENKNRTLKWWQFWKK